MTRWLVTGGAGFIGSHLVEHLLESGDAVEVIDDLTTGGRENVPRGAHLHEGSASELSLVRSVVSRVDAVVHLAAIVGVRAVVRAPARVLAANLAATEAVLTACADNNVRVVIASSSEVYGKSTRFPLSETDDLTLGGPHVARWSYAAGKLADEHLALGLWREEGTPATVVRLFNTVGPRQRSEYGMVIPTFVRQALVGRPITVFGSGAQTRAFCHVADVVRALAQLARTRETVGGIYNIGSDREIAIEDLAQRVRTATGSRSSIVRVPYEQAFGENFEDPARRVPDLRRIRAAIGWAPTRTIDDVLADILATAPAASRAGAPSHP